MASKNQDSQMSEGASSTQHDGQGQQSYALLEYLCAEPTIIEQISSATWAGEGGKGKEKSREDKVKDALKKFEDAWRDASK
ncbi:hypothetical protein F4820DRAFT_400981 [Hypoxylon rubiginosum]|uniref:Uncharacterized protein n=1 Tax=Hypoxylon rubiginosum TaxID=110542 RepID=A0ACB9ZH44_9PEZI|nr:hypothetical protein F4820DRAFT_400981 [Hypoxylon rubiginosum]